MDSNGEKKDFWSFNGTTWTQLSSNFSGYKRRGASAFVVNNKAYVVGGGFFDDSYFCQLSDVQEYDPETNTWTEKVFADGLNLSVNGATAFAHDGKGYICYGNKKYVVSYNPVNNQIENLNDVFNLGNNRDYPVSFVLEGISYVGLGSNGLWTTAYYNDIVPFYNDIVPLFDETTNIKTPSINAIHVYPNPVSESFHIVGIVDNTFVTISDISGKMMLQHTVAPCEVVSVAHLPKGVYIVQVAGKVVKIIKQ
jgi:hypothetical protein